MRVKLHSHLDTNKTETDCVREEAGHLFLQHVQIRKLLNSSSPRTYLDSEARPHQDVLSLRFETTINSFFVEACRLILKLLQHRTVPRNLSLSPGVPQHTKKEGRE